MASKNHSTAHAGNAHQKPSDAAMPDALKCANHAVWVGAVGMSCIDDRILPLVEGIAELANIVGKSEVNLQARISLIQKLAGVARNTCVDMIDAIDAERLEAQASLAVLQGGK